MSERTLVVSKDFMDAVLLGKTLYQKSLGAFNPLVDISRFGYDADIALVKGTERSGKNTSMSYNIDMHAVRVNQEAMTVSLEDGQSLDFGGYLKGHTAEKMAKAAIDCQGVLVNLGGDIYARGLDSEGKPFVFSIDNPSDPGADLSFFATNVGIATSGSYNRHWTHKGVPFFHILDSAGAGNPVTELVSATVIADTGAEADAFATVAIILGVEKGTKMLEAHGLEYCLLKKDGSTLFSRGFPLIRKALSLLYVQ
jgi:thiamine biosynthesis lipoprotein